jgi:cation diffusion facilitator family transporter
VSDALAIPDPSGALPPEISPRVAQIDAGSESTRTVVIAFAANLLVAAAKTVAAVITGSASMVAEAVHSWADTGNEIFLLVADRTSRRPADRDHALGYGREAYVWSMFAAIGLFAVGAGVSITHGVQELFDPEPATDFGVAYVVLALSCVLEGTSFLRSVRQARPEAAAADRELFEHVVATSDPTLRAVFAEDFAALIGLVLAFVGVLTHQLTGSAIPDALGSIAVGLVLGVVAVVLIQRNRVFLVGAGVDARTRRATLTALLALPDVVRVTYLRIEFVGPRAVYLVASVDLVGDDVESSLARRLAALERRIAATPRIAGVVLTLSTPEEPSLVP